MKLEKAIKVKRPKLANSKGILFYHDNVRPDTSLATCTKCSSLIGKWCSIVHIALTFNCQTIIYFEVYKAFKMVKISVIKMILSHTWFLLIRTRSSMSAELQSYHKEGKRSSNKMEDSWLIKVHFLYRNNWVLFHTRKPKLFSY